MSMFNFFAIIIILYYVIPLAFMMLGGKLDHVGWPYIIISFSLLLIYTIIGAYRDSDTYKLRKERKTQKRLGKFSVENFNYMKRSNNHQKEELK